MDIELTLTVIRLILQALIASFSLTKAIVFFTMKEERNRLLKCSLLFTIFVFTAASYIMYFIQHIS